MYWHRSHLSKIWDKEYKDLDYISNNQIAGKVFDKKPFPEWLQNIENMVDYRNIVLSAHLLVRGDIIPKHRELFENYYPDIEKNIRKIYTIIVMLEDWKSGHYLEINNAVISNWKAGTYFLCNSDVPFSIANVGTDNFYFLKMTGASTTIKDVVESIHWFNFPDIESKKESFTPQFSYKLQSYTNIKNPHFVFMSDGYIRDLDDITHNQTTIAHLNKTGIDIFLHKPLCGYYLNRPNIFENGETKHTQWNYSEFSHTDDPNNIRAEELDSILNYVIRNNLTKVNVHTCEYNSKIFYPFYKNKINILTNNTAIITGALPPVQNTTLTADFSKKFICINWRHTPHRHLTAAYVCQLSSHLSWYFVSDIVHLEKEIWYNIENWRKTDPDLYQKIIDGIKFLNENSPYCLDLPSRNAAKITHSYYKQILPDVRHLSETNVITQSHKLENFYKEVFCDVVTESRFAQPTGFISERTLIPMVFKKPFIMIGPPHTLKYLKQLGFKTFDQIWDESYDDIEDHELRLKTIFKILDDINECKIEFLKEIYMNASDILEHNYNRTLELLGRNK